jgi:hypothetical protein
MNTDEESASNDQYRARYDAERFSEYRAFDAFMDGEYSFADDDYAEYCTVEHTWVDAGDGMFICTVCQAER